MSRLIKKHRRQVFGVALPVFFLFVLGAVGVSVFPGWVKPTYGTLGAPCVTSTLDTTDTTLLTACDPCLLEECVGLNGGATCQYNFFNSSGNSTDLNCPMCWCTPTITSVASGFQYLPLCGNSGSDAFCQGIAGGDVTNDCRVGVCTQSGTFDNANPSGCDFNFDTADTSCINCAPPSAASVNCGNGVCEEDSGETFNTCPEDCKVPGFPFATPEPTDFPTQACPDVATITFPGNITNSNACEDGNICTVNECGPNDGICHTTAAVCDANTADFCCPAGCTDTTDLDCLPPQDCIPSPSPIPTPTFGPIVPPLEISGNSVVGCGLNAGAVSAPFSMLWLLAPVMASMLALRRHKK